MLVLETDAPYLLGGGAHRLLESRIAVGEHAAEAQLEAERSRPLHRLGAVGEAVQHAAGLRARLLEHGHRALVLAALVDDHRQSDLVGERELHAEPFDLRLDRRIVAEGVEPDLADRDHARVARPLAQRRQVLEADLPSGVRVHAHGEVDVGVFCGERERLVPDRGFVGDLDQMGHADVARAVEHVHAVAIEALVAEVDVGVDHARLRPRRCS
jgi:hypothetical protein